MNPIVVYLAILGLGFVSGLRTFTPIALVSWLAIWGWMPLAGSPFWFIGSQPFAIIISILAVLELIGDKLPKTPARTHAMPLLGRVITGAVCAGAVCFTAGVPWLIGSSLGAIGSLAGAFGGYYVRRFIVGRWRVPDLIVALAEDFLTVAGALYLVHNFFHTPI